MTDKKERKPYETPSLEVYGDLRTLTKAKGGKKTEAGLPKSKNSGSN